MMNKRKHESNPWENVVNTLVKEQETKFQGTDNEIRMQKQALKHQLIRNYEHLGHQLQKGYLALMQELQACQNAPGSVPDDSPLADIGDLRDYDLSTKDWAAAQKDTDHSLQKALGITDRQMEVLYAASTRLFEREQFDKAAAALATICLLNSEAQGPIVAYGKTLEATGDHQSALVCYQEAIQKDPFNITAYRYGVACALKHNQQQTARQFVDAGQVVLKSEVEFEGKDDFITGIQELNTIVDESEEQ